MDEQLPVNAMLQSGRYFSLPTDELRTHCLARADHHRQRSTFYREKTERLEGEAREAMATLEGDEALAEKSSSNYGRRVNEREEARSASISHGKKALRFDWYAKHLALPQYTYLTTHDLSHFELIPD